MRRTEVKTPFMSIHKAVTLIDYKETVPNNCDNVHTVSCTLSQHCYLSMAASIVALKLASPKCCQKTWPRHHSDTNLFLCPYFLSLSLFTFFIYLSVFTFSSHIYIFIIPFLFRLFFSTTFPFFSIPSFFLYLLSFYSHNYFNPHPLCLVFLFFSKLFSIW
ncbi:unnamed protein product [Acanthosepion pharaonis]|uniref:Uncharacterized protein n=1 Tax=Acanthosepion pharaonis TaxID=158019 RepID=A0A812DXX5_ACAPH|nr:unnamed protein product [Sepia pharaonis]